MPDPIRTCPFIFPPCLDKYFYVALDAKRICKVEMKKYIHQILLKGDDYYVNTGCGVFKQGDFCLRINTPNLDFKF